MADDDWVARLPRAETTAGTVLLRIHRSENAPLHFSQNGTGRFDPPPQQRGEFGACYLGVDRLAAFVEVFGRTRLVTEAMIAARSLTEIQPTRGLTVVDLTDRRLLGRTGRVLPEFAVGPRYEQSQQLAGQLVAAGVDGVRYHARHDPALTAKSVAIFSAAQSALEVVKTTPIPDELVAEAERVFELLVLPETPLG